MSGKEENPYSKLKWNKAKPPADYIWEVFERYPIRSTEQLTQPEVDYIHALGAKLFRRIKGAYVVVNGDTFDLYWDIPLQEFERIRRITGYLVGTLDRFNDAKRSEESQRVKHKVGGRRGGQ